MIGGTSITSESFQRQAREVHADPDQPSCVTASNGNRYRPFAFDKNRELFREARATASIDRSKLVLLKRREHKNYQLLYRIKRILILIEFLHEADVKNKSCTHHLEPEVGYLGDRLLSPCVERPLSLEVRLMYYENLVNGKRCYAPPPPRPPPKKPNETRHHGTGFDHVYQIMFSLTFRQRTRATELRFFLEISKACFWGMAWMNVMVVDTVHLR